ncbi:unnamed protein product, partial [Protopolystoma xenopodis]
MPHHPLAQRSRECVTNRDSSSHRIIKAWQRNVQSEVDMEYYARVYPVANILFKLVTFFSFSSSAPPPPAGFRLFCSAPSINDSLSIVSSHTLYFGRFRIGQL